MKRSDFVDMITKKLLNGENVAGLNGGFLVSIADPELTNPVDARKWVDENLDDWFYKEFCAGRTLDY